MPLNLVQDRGGPSVWDRRRAWRARGPTWAAALLAGGLMTIGLRRRSRGGWLMAAAGGGLAWWAVFGGGRPHRAHLRAVWPLRRPSTDEVSEASEESFPASDAPSWTTTGSSGPSGTPSS